MCLLIKVATLSCEQQINRLILIYRCKPKWNETFTN